MLKRDKIIVGFVVINFAGLGAMLAMKAQSHSMQALPQPLKVSSAQIIDESRPMLGPKNAPYTLVEFGDYQCPPCANAHPQVMALIKQHPTTLRFQFRNLPLRRIHPLAQQAAMVAETAGEDGKFWQTHNMLYEKHDLLSKSFLVQMARKETGNSEQARKNIQADEQAAKKIGVEGTPTFLLCTPDNKVLMLHSLSQMERDLPE